ncbi:hypothetical protein RUM44_007173 [Polyplax serrata]|uniref:C2H2-type domain-containing protein n=1 Tax=Polyplax serrata TaxID=468196 RepID=A0ABR1B1T9_POLSC
MRTKYISWEVIVLVVLSIIPWPGPTVFKISCPRDSASVVRKLIQKKWVPVLEKYQVKIPIECPFHPGRDILGPQQAAKHQYRASQWSCGFCGKSFYEERFLELHFDNIHKNEINVAEDAVCLADYCDIMRCEVLVTQEMKNQYLSGQGQINTDIEIWREASVYKTALTLSGPRELVKVKGRDAKIPHQRKKVKSNESTRPPQTLSGTGCEKASEKQEKLGGKNTSPDSGDTDTNNTKDTCEGSDLIDSALPPSDKRQRLHEFQKLKANCKPEELLKLKQRCEVLVQDCIAGLLVNLSMQEYKEVEQALNKAVCWYLTCDRYWEDSLEETRPFPWALVFVLVMVLSLAICLVYYIIWVLFDAKEINQTLSGRTTPSHYGGMQPPYQEEFFPPSDVVDPTQGERYIYVTYPPELKRRLMER